MNDSGKVASPIRHRFLAEHGLLSFGWVAGALSFVALTGLGIWLLPFSVTSQMTVLAHTLVGVLILLPFTIWQLSHWLATRRAPRSFRKICAYAGFWLLAASCLTGAIVTCEALFSLRVTHDWDSLHFWTSLFALPFLVYHFVPRGVRGVGEPAVTPAGPAPDYGPARRRMWARVLATTVALVAVTAVATKLCRAPAYANYEPPAKYLAVHGENAFAPSFAATTAGRPIAPEVLASSASCGAPGCHSAIYREWRASAHRWSAEDEFFQAVRTATTEVQGRGVTEKCGACHDPVSLLAGYKDPSLGRAAPGYREGDSCAVCHAVRRADERGIGSYELELPQPYLEEYSSNHYGLILAHFLIRAYPQQHNRDYDLTLAREARSCAPCHKEFDVLDKRVGPVQVETQYDDWKRGKWNTDPDVAKRLRCQQCHMHFEIAASDSEADPYDVKVGLGRKYRNHHFAAGNQFMPETLGAPDATLQVRRVSEWLKGERVVPEIEKVWPRGPLLALEIAAPASARAGDRMNLQVKLTNKKVGHSFPTGPLNIGRAWIELTVLDAAGREIFHSGGLDREHHIEPGSYVLKPLAITADGKDLLFPDLWHPVGPKFRLAVLPGRSDIYDFQLVIPADTQGPLKITTRLLYRKANQFFMDSVYSPGSRQAPTTVIASAQAEITLIDSPPACHSLP